MRSFCPQDKQSTGWLVLGREDSKCGGTWIRTFEIQLLRILVVMRSNNLAEFGKRCGGHLAGSFDSATANHSS